MSSTRRLLQSKAQSPVLLDMLSQWAVRYRAFTQRRYALYSTGAGNWPGLASDRKRNKEAAKRKKEKNVRQAILRDTNTMYNTFEAEVRNPGSVEEKSFLKVEAGVGGADPHPKAGVAISELLRWHNDGEGYLPERKIVVKPDKETIEDMGEDLRRAILILMRGGG